MKVESADNQSQDQNETGLEETASGSGGNPDVQEVLQRLWEMFGNIDKLKAEKLRYEMVCKVLNESNFESADDTIRHADVLVDYVLNGKKGAENA